MPKEFEQCVDEEDSKVRTVSGPDENISLDKGEFRRICIDSDGESYLGEIKTKDEEDD